jgi:hypothetical protein
MSTPTALLPHKHVRFSDSTLGVAGKLRSLLDQPRSVDELQALLEHARSHGGWPGRATLSDIVSALSVLYALHQIELCAEGRVKAVRR